MAVKLASELLRGEARQSGSTDELTQRARRDRKGLPRCQHDGNRVLPQS
jgi:hypothetical protein